MNDKKCKFDVAYIGVCNEQTTEGDYCDKHTGIACEVCGSQANRTCSFTGQFVCGTPLCENCEGYEPENYSNSEYDY